MKYKCSVCGYIHDEEATGILLKDLGKCPICKQPISKFVPLEDTQSEEMISTSELDYHPDYVKSDESIRAMDAIHQMAVTDESIVEAMYTPFPMPNWDDIFRSNLCVEEFIIPVVTAPVISLTLLPVSI